MKNQTCCFTGHRDLPLQKLPYIQKRLEQELLRLIHQGVRYFGAGGALGFDTLAALTVLRLRETHPHIRLILVLPCREQASGWPEKDIRTYEQIKRRADKVVFTSEHYFRGCMQLRNRHLAEHSGVCVCYLDKPSGGTRYTVDTCRRLGIPVINLVQP